VLDIFSLAALLVIAGCVSAIFFFSLSEAALVAVSDATVSRLIDKGDRRAELVRQLVSTGEYLSALIVGLNACVILSSTMMTVLVHRTLGDGYKHDWRSQVAHIGMVAFLLVVAELVPKTYGSVFAERLALRVAGPIRWMMRVTAPFSNLLNGLCRTCLRISGGELLPARHLVTQDEIKAAADIGEEEGIVEPEEGEMLDSVIEMTGTTVREIMVPRVDVVALPVTASVDEMLTAAVESGYSRIPVYAENIDHITGVIYVNDLLRQFQDGIKPLELSDLAREPFLVPETKRVWELFREMRERKVHIAIVIDEYGGTEGVVTIEDILEELVGEIEDEHDTPAEEVKMVGENEALVEANTRIEHVNEALGLDLPEEEYETLGGLVAGIGGRIPAPAQRIWVAGVEIVVEEGNAQRLQSLRVIIHREDEG